MTSRPKNENFFLKIGYLLVHAENRQLDIRYVITDFAKYSLGVTANLQLHCNTVKQCVVFISRKNKCHIRAHIKAFSP